MAYACNAVIMIMVHVAMEMAFSFELAKGQHLYPFYFARTPFRPCLK